MRWVIGLAFLFAASAQAAVFDGREYVLGGRVDEAGTGAESGPLIIALHGMKGSGPKLRDTANLGPMTPGATIAYPTAPDGIWNDGRFDHMGNRVRKRAKQDDVDWLVRFARHLGHEQFYVIGHSNGGGMAMRLTCDAEAHVLGIANVSTKVLSEFECKGQAPVPMVIFYGTDDRISPHSGRPTGREGVLGLRMGRGHDADTSVAMWAARNKCGEARVVTADPAPTDGGHLRIHTYQNCAAPLVYYEMIGAGHGFPGAPALTRPALRALIGGPIDDVSAGPAAAKVWFGE